MGRIRTVKPELFLDEELGALSGDHLALFVGLFTMADREGRLEDRPVRIKACLFPYRAIDVDSLLGDLAAAQKIVRYEVGGAQYVAIPGFTKHQRPHPKEPPSTVPGPGGARPVVRERWVYFIRSGEGGPIKIGSAQNVQHRIETLQTSHPEQLVLLCAIPAPPGTEAGLHRRFASLRLRGEWFRPAPELLAHIEECSLSTAGNVLAVHEVKVIPSSPVGREGKGREGDLGREPQAEPSQKKPEPPTETDTPATQAPKEPDSAATEQASDDVNATNLVAEVEALFRAATGGEEFQWGFPNSPEERALRTLATRHGVRVLDVIRAAFEPSYPSWHSLARLVKDGDAAINQLRAKASKLRAKETPQEATRSARTTGRTETAGLCALCSQEANGATWGHPLCSPHIGAWMADRVPPNPEATAAWIERQKGSAA